MRKFKSYFKNLKNENGVGIPIAIFFVMLVVASGIFVPQFIDRNRGLARKFNDDFKMKQVAFSALEVGKYLLYYEKAFYLNNALEQPMKNGKNEFDLLTPGTQAWADVCGDPGFSTGTQMQHNGKKTFCPLKLRDPFVSGDYIESFLFDFTDSALEAEFDGDADFKWDEQSESYHLGPVFLSPRGGTKRQCKGDTKPMPDDNETTALHMFHLNIEPKIKCYLDNEDAGDMDGYDRSIQLDYYFYGKSSAFTSYGSERYVKIVATVHYRPFTIGNIATGTVTSTSAEESLMFQTSTMKDFALFFAYPSMDASGTPTKNLMQSLQVTNDSEIHGKTFFDGNVEVSFKDDNDEKVLVVEDFPIFNDALILTGSVSDPIAPTDKNISALKSKFKKGILVNFGDHLVYDSEKVMNQTSGLKRKFLNSDFSMQDVDINVYVTNMVDRTECSFTFDQQPLKNKPRTDIVLTNANDSLKNCQELGEWSDVSRKPLYGGGLRQIRTQRNEEIPTFVMAPAAQMEFQKPRNNFIGVYVGGQVVADGVPTNFYSLLNVDPTKDIGGITDYTDVSMINKESSKVQAGVGVPLRNLVIVLDQ